MVKFNKLKIVLIVLCLLFLTSYEFRGQESTETSYQNSTNELTDKQKDALNNGYQVGKYRIFITEENKKTTQDCTDPQKLDQKSNFWRSVFLWQNIISNSN